METKPRPSSPFPRPSGGGSWPGSYRIHAQARGRDPTTPHFINERGKPVCRTPTTTSSTRSSRPALTSTQVLAPEGRGPLRRRLRQTQLRPRVLPAIQSARFRTEDQHAHRADGLDLLATGRGAHHENDTHSSWSSWCAAAASPAQAQIAVIVNPSVSAAAVDAANSRTSSSGPRPRCPTGRQSNRSLDRRGRPTTRS